MTRITLYTGGGVTFSPVYAEGRVLSNYVRLKAEAGRGITDGNIVTTCVDTRTPDAWTDCDLQEDIDDAEAFSIIFGGAE